MCHRLNTTYSSSYDNRKFKMSLEILRDGHNIDKDSLCMDNLMFGIQFGS